MILLISRIVSLLTLIGYFTSICANVTLTNVMEYDNSLDTVPLPRPCPIAWGFYLSLELQFLTSTVRGTNWVIAVSLCASVHRLLL